MKKLTIGILVLLLLLFGSVAAAETGEETQISAMLRQSGVFQPIQLSVWGDTAACFAETDGVKRLLILEKKNSAWRIVIDNPTALIQDYGFPSLWLDSDNAVFWTYTLSEQEIVRYHSTRNADGTWGPVDQYHSDSGYGEYTYVWSTIWDDANGGEIIRTFAMVDENDNDHGIQRMQVLPAFWMKDCVRLECFDLSRFPTMLGVYDGYFAYENERFFREAAAAIMPEYTFIKGMLKDAALHFLMEKPDGARVYVVCEYASQRRVNLIESTPLPSGTALGYENFTDCLWINDRCLSIRLLGPGTAGIEYIYDDAAVSGSSEGFLFFGSQTVWDDAEVPAQAILYGNHPWNDIAQIDWSSLPRALDEASARMDASRYAMVVNPKPDDRLNLREQADKSSRSLGKYYTGTPVTVLKEEGDWARVMIGQAGSGGQQGWMMKKYLSFGQPSAAIQIDPSAMPRLFSREEILKVYEEPQFGQYILHPSSDQMLVIGVIGDEWYHVWFPQTEEYGFVPQSSLTPGNG